MKLVVNHQSSSSFKVTSENSFSTVTVGDYYDLWKKDFLHLIGNLCKPLISTVTAETEDKLKEKSELCRSYVAISIDQDFAI